MFNRTTTALTALALTHSALAAGQTITVTTVEDTSDFGGAMQIANLPGPDGKVSFREAVTASNNTPGGETIAFAIPLDEYWLDPSLALLKIESGIIFSSSSDVVFDFTTQATNIADTNPNGPDVGIFGLEPNGWGFEALRISGSNCTIIGLGSCQQRGYAARLMGSNNRVIGCDTLGPLSSSFVISGSNNTVGGTEPGEGNRLSGLSGGLEIAGAQDAVVIGNEIYGGDNGLLISGSTGTRIGGPSDAERNVIYDAGFTCCEGAAAGAQVVLQNATATLIENNWIGLTPDGVGAGNKGPRGVQVLTSDLTTIRANVIADIIAFGIAGQAGNTYGAGIELLADATNTVIEANLIGVGPDGVTPIPNYTGIRVDHLSTLDHPENTLIEGNLIASSVLAGLQVGATATATTITATEFVNNGGSGIELAALAGKAPPTIVSATAGASAVTLEATLDASPLTDYTIEFFANAECDPSGAGEGERFLGAATVTTDSAGLATIVATLDAMAASGEAATATATNLATGDTSAFSLCTTITPGDDPLDGDINNDGIVNSLDLNAVLGEFGCTTGCTADTDGDGDVDSQDLNQVLANFGVAI